MMSISNLKKKYINKKKFVHYEVRTTLISDLNKNYRIMKNRFQRIPLFCFYFFSLYIEVSIANIFNTLNKKKILNQQKK